MCVVRRQLAFAGCVTKGISATITVMLLKSGVISAERIVIFRN